MNEAPVTYSLVRLWLPGQGVTELSFERTQAVLRAGDVRLA